VLPIPSRIIDLSPVVTPDLPQRVWGHELLARNQYSDATNFEDFVRRPPPEGNWAGYVANSNWTLMNHAGAHIDAPNHLFEGAPAVADYPLTQLIGPLKVIDARTQAINEPILRSIFDGIDILPGDVVLLYVAYTPPVDPGALPRYAYLSSEAAEYLALIPIRAFATDAWSVDSPPRDDRPRGGPVVHSAFLSRGIPTIEQLANVHALLTESAAVFVGFPLKVPGVSGNGSPIRAAALIY
jgi:kynurenine formamidase